MTIAYIGLGSNLRGGLNSPKENIVSAIQALGEIQSTRMINTSSLYQSKPVGPQGQADYINAVVKLDTELDATELLGILQAIENDHGRERKEHWGARTLDLDILLFGDQLIQDEGLTIPHIEISNRCFVLLPLAELEPTCVIPGQGLVSDLAAKIDQTNLKVVK
jgi:2-amino-4-hydroxy-6-hydroxymethyldihydropteridine diphosphokinase